MWHGATDGIELTSALNASTSLPTPSGTPVPPDRLEEQPGISAGNTVLDAISPPEPTPALMRHIDHVRSTAQHHLSVELADVMPSGMLCIS